MLAIISIQNCVVFNGFIEIFELMGNFIQNGDMYTFQSFWKRICHCPFSSKDFGTLYHLFIWPF